MRNGKRLLTLMTIFGAAGALWSLIDEYWILGSPAGVFMVWCMWIFLPALNLLCGLWTSNWKILTAAVLLASFYLFLFTGYAFNGSTEEKMGAQHMHIYLVPFMVLPLCSLLFFLFMLREYVKTHPRNTQTAVAVESVSGES